MPSGHEVVAQFMSQEDEDNGDGVAGSSCHPGGDDRQDEEDDMDELATHENGLFLFLMAVPVKPLSVFMLRHLLSPLLNDTSHNFSFAKGMPHAGGAPLNYENDLWGKVKRYKAMQGYDAGLVKSEWVRADGLKSLPLPIDQTGIPP